MTVLYEYFREHSWNIVLSRNQYNDSLRLDLVSQMKDVSPQSFVALLT